MIPLLVTVARRLAAAVATLVVISALLFAAVEVLPGDAARRSLPRDVTPAQVEIRRAQLGLDQPPLARYLSWSTGVVRGDLGTSLATRRPVSDIIAGPLGNTLALAAIAFAAVAVLVVLGALAVGARPGSARDAVVSTTSLALFSLPEFVIAGLLISLFAWRLDWLPPVSLVPVSGGVFDRPSIVVLPVLTIVLVSAPYGLRLARAVVADVGRLPYVDAARLQGVPEHRVQLRYLLPSALGPITQALAFYVPYLLGGVVVVERIFGYPGLGELLVDSVGRRDFPVVEAGGLLVAAAAVACLLAADVVALLANPQLRGRAGS